MSDCIPCSQNHREQITLDITGRTRSMLDWLSKHFNEERGQVVERMIEAEYNREIQKHLQRFRFNGGKKV